MATLTQSEMTQSDPFRVNELTEKVAAVEQRVGDLLNQDISSPVLRTIAELWRVSDIRNLKETFTAEFARMRDVFSSTKAPGDPKTYVDLLEALYVADAALHLQRGQAGSR